ncbi:copper resistance protein CopC [Amycolatopsis thermalba]|uniref:Copper resistance protein CopC n=1 Tax=Amycolatopsis thermalba TaxID=944492 RepID=A0ABY4NQI9_9PSEU|nr:MULTISPECIES: copper resistance CopC family protein [Amycolatopsis]OXM74452.1 copper resistance protein CopC [Amycolatopsis sp. KNN50.9b]UQS21847.1 copper resistance protein CopC [Amycolatopsis thermalba]
MRRLLVTIAAALVAMVVTATPALAHNVLVSSDPAKGATLDTAPSQVTLTFDAPVQGGNVNQVSVTGPGGTQWAEGDVRISSNVVTVAVRPLGPAGQYTVGFRILSADGHPVTGEVPFTLTKAGTGTPATASAATGTDTAQPAAQSGGGVPVWVWIVGAVVLLAIGLTLALRMGRDKA